MLSKKLLKVNPLFFLFFIVIPLVGLLGNKSLVLLDKIKEMNEIRSTLFQKDNCINSFDTIVCHQMKINKLLKERALKGD